MYENPKEAAGRSKLQLQLVPTAAKREMTLALEIGGIKYGFWNWRGAGICLMTYIGAMQRHLDAIQNGEDMDPSSGVSHIGHILAGAAVVADATDVGMLTDDRPAVEKGHPDSVKEDVISRKAVHGDEAQFAEALMARGFRT